MSEEHVYELDADTLLARLVDALGDGGYEIVEGPPAGLWWFKTAHDREHVMGAIEATVHQLLEHHLTEVEQDHSST